MPDDSQLRGASILGKNSIFGSSPLCSVQLHELWRLNTKIRLISHHLQSPTVEAVNAQACMVSEIQSLGVWYQVSCVIGGTVN